MVEVVLMALRAFDGKRPIMGRAWLVMKNRNNMFLSLWNQSLSLPSNFENVVEDQFYH
jgi:hypothetical protein